MDSQHKHLILRAEVETPPTDPAFIEEWIVDLTKRLDMKLVDVVGNPLCTYVDKDGNRGLTAVAIIETSHIALHVWDKQDPPILQLDVYTCKALDPTSVFDCIEEFGVLARSFMIIDREHVIHKLLT